MAVLALVLAEARVLEERLGAPPLVLLDDVLSELDEDRRQALASLVAERGQVVVTASVGLVVPARACAVRSSSRRARPGWNRREPWSGSETPSGRELGRTGGGAGHALAGSRRSGRRRSATRSRGRHGHSASVATGRCTSPRRPRPGRSSSTGSHRGSWNASQRSRATRRRLESGSARARSRSRERRRRTTREAARRLSRQQPRRKPRPRSSPGRSRIRNCDESLPKRLAQAFPGPVPAAKSDRLHSARKTTIYRDFAGLFLLAEAAYTAKDITVLEGLEPVRLRPGMYIGSTGSTGPPSPRLRGGGQRRRRGSRGTKRACRHHDPSRQLGHRDGRRGGHPGRHDRRPGAAGAHRRSHQAPCRREVRRRRLQGLRWPARRRRVGRERALGVARRRGPSRREGVPAGVRARRADRRDGDRRRRAEERVGNDDLVPPRPGGLRGDGVRRGDADAAPARDGIPHPRPQDHRPRRACRRKVRGVPLRGRHPRLRRVRQRVEGHRPQARRLRRGRER